MPYPFCSENARLFRNYEKGPASECFILKQVLSAPAARGAGAYGGTVIHAKGTGMEYAEKYLGVTIAAEKEMIFIVTKKEQKNGIMKAIMEQAGMDSAAKTVVFSLPVTDTAGLRLVDIEE